MLISRASIVDYESESDNLDCYHFEVNNYHVKVRYRRQKDPLDAGVIVFERGFAAPKEVWLDEDHAEVIGALKNLEAVILKQGRHNKPR